MSDRLEQSSREAILALRRIRAVESPPDGEGIRTVWHQGARGTDLVSYVTMEGKVVRQEFALLGDQFLWTSADGLRTGTISGESTGGSKAGPASGLVALDPSMVPERVIRAAAAIAAYDGDDKYVLHLKRTLQLTATGLQNTEEATVTRTYSGSAIAEAVARRREERVARPVGALAIAVVLAIAAAVTAVVMLR